MRGVLTMRIAIRPCSSDAASFSVGVSMNWKKVRPPGEISSWVPSGKRVWSGTSGLPTS